MLLLVHTVVEAPDRGLGRARDVGAFALAPRLLGRFVAIERRTQGAARAARHPALGLARARELRAAALFGAYIGFQFVLTLYLQTMNGWSAFETALAFLPAGLLVAFGSTRIGPLVDRYGTARAGRRRRVLVGARLRAGAAARRAPDYAAVLLPTMLLIGIGFMLGFPSLNMQATNGIADHEQGLASGLVQTLVPGRRRARAGGRERDRHLAGGRVDRPRRAARRLPDRDRRDLAIAVAGLLVALSGLVRARDSGSRRRPRTDAAPTDGQRAA